MSGSESAELKEIRKRHAGAVCRRDDVDALLRMVDELKEHWGIACADWERERDELRAKLTEAEHRATHWENFAGKSHELREAAEARVRELEALVSKSMIDPRRTG